jgi:chromosome segregation ATPase
MPARTQAAEEASVTNAHHTHGVQGDDYEIVPGSEMVVARKADRRSQSTYYVNDKTVRLEEVTTLLKGRGIDLDHNRFLILQVAYRRHARPARCSLCLWR